MEVSRRALLGGGAALAGATAVGVLTQNPVVAFAGGASDEELEALEIPVMLSVVDAKAGRLEILVGERAIEFTDRKLVGQLARATRQGGQ